MNQKGKRLISLMVFLVTLFSFLPLNLRFNENAAEAALLYDEIDVVAVGSGVENSIKHGESEFEFEYGKQNIFVGVQNGITADETGRKLDGTGQIAEGETAVFKQQFVVESINGVDVSSATDLDAINDILEPKLGCTIVKTNNDSVINANRGSQSLVSGSKNLIGINIEGLSYGVNTITYKLVEGRVTRSEDGLTYSTVTETYPQGAQESITIYHGTKYLSNTIDYITSVSYIGGNKQQYNENINDGEEKQNNKIPFKYIDRADEDEKYPLKYTFNVPDSTQTLEYEINFQSSVGGNASLLLNGRSTDSTTSGNVISGTFTSLFDKAILVIKFDNSINTENLIKSYSLQINCNLQGVNDDFTLRDAGIIKYEYPNESDVPAFVGKEFNRKLVDERGNKLTDLTYEGILYVDSRARKISINPELGSSKDMVFKYKDEVTVMKDGKLFVDVDNISGTNRTITIEAFEARNGVAVNSTVLVRYIFKVIEYGNGDVSSLNLSFGDTAYLTQPGRETKIPFDENRYVYNFYCEDRIDVELLSPQTSKNEYIRVFFGNSTTSTQLTEANESIENSRTEIDSNSNTVTKKNSSLTNISVGSYEKMVIQVYYDKVEKDDSGAITNVVPTKLGHEYVFYIMKNIDDDSTDQIVSSDASLKDLTVEEGRLIDTDGNKGFSTTMYTYTVEVPKDADYANITAITKDKVKEITATINETSDSYDMESGKNLKIPLNESGMTTVKIKVTAEDGVSSKNYTVVINNSEKGSGCELENIIVTPGDYEFDPDIKKTKVRVDINIKKVEITPIPVDEKSKIYVDDKKFNGTPIEISLASEQEVEVEILVVSEDGKKSREYTVIITRRDADSVEDDTEDEDVFYDKYNECWVDTSKYEEWGKIEGRDVYFDKNGRQVKDSWITVGKYGNYKYYYLNNKGYKYTGWLVDSTGAKYFLDQITGERKTGYFNDNGTWYYFEPLTGKMKTGWLYVKETNNWKYFTEAGQMIVNTTINVDGKTYNFGIDGYIY